MLRHLMTSWHLNIWKVKIWISLERKELSKWTKKHFSLFHKCYLFGIQNKPAKLYRTQPLTTVFLQKNYTLWVSYIHSLSETIFTIKLTFQNGLFIFVWGYAFDILCTQHTYGTSSPFKFQSPLKTGFLWERYLQFPS